MTPCNQNLRQPHSEAPEDLPTESEMLRRCEEYLLRLREIRMSEVLQNYPVEGDQPIAEQIESALLQHIYELRREIIWKETPPHAPTQKTSEPTDE